MAEEVLSDLSETICARQLPVEWIFAFLLSDCPISKLELLARAGTNYMQFKRTKDPKFFYQTLEGLPVMEDLSFVNRLTANQNWDKIIEKLKPKIVHVVTQDDCRVAEAYLKTPYNKYRFKELKIEVKLLEANEALHKNGFYTGEAELNVTPQKIFYYASLGIPFIGDGNIDQALKHYPELQKNLIVV